MNRQPETIFEDEPIANHQSASKYNSPIKSKLTVNPSDDNNSVTLTHTLSVYRRQQQTQSYPSSPVRRVVHANTNYQPSDENNDSDDEIDRNDPIMYSEENLVKEKIKSLMDTVGIQQQQIGQASNALNTCASTVEFSGSTASVVAEWKLLVASEFRN